MANNAILNKILNWLKGSAIGAILGAVAAAFTLYWGFSDRLKKPDLEISIKGHSMSKGPKCDIYYLIPQDYFESDMKGALVFELSNQGKAELENAYTSFETSSVYQTEEQMTLSTGVAQTVDNKTLRFRRFAQQDTVDFVAGEQIKVSYSDEDETMTCLFKTIQRGLVKLVQPVFTIDKEFMKEIDAAAQTNNLGEHLGAKVYDAFSMDLSYGATGIKADKVKGIKVVVAEDCSIEELLSYYEKDGSLFSAVIYDEDNVKKNRCNCILVYPRYYVIDGVVNLDVDGGQYYYVEYDLKSKKGKTRSMKVKNLNTDQEVTYRYNN